MPSAVPAPRRTDRPYREQLEELRVLLTSSTTAAVPVRGGNVPELWLLGSSPVFDETGTTELMITSPIDHHADRRRGYQPVSAISGGVTSAGAAGR